MAVSDPVGVRAHQRARNEPSVKREDLEAIFTAIDASDWNGAARHCHEEMQVRAAVARPQRMAARNGSGRHEVAS